MIEWLTATVIDRLDRDTVLLMLAIFVVWQLRQTTRHLVRCRDGVLQGDQVRDRMKDRLLHPITGLYG